MGRWLNALKNHENGKPVTCQNCQNLDDSGFVSFGSASFEEDQKIVEAAGEVSSVLSGPVSGINEIFCDVATPAGLPKSDAEQYIDALRIIGPCGYGGVGSFVGWGMTRASQVEAEVRQAGLVQYDRTGRATVVETKTTPF